MARQTRRLHEALLTSEVYLVPQVDR